MSSTNLCLLWKALRINRQQHRRVLDRLLVMRLLAFILLFAPIFLVGQTIDPTNPGARPIDTSFAAVDTAIERRNGILDVFEGNPGTAALRGLMIPAGGQIYNKRWWKVPLALGVEGATIGYLVYSYNLYNKWDAEYRHVIAGGIPTLGQTNTELILKNRNQLRSDRELAWVIFAVGHIFTAFEAYIDRHLMEFDVSDDLTFTPTVSPFGISPSLTYSIPLHTTRYQTVPIFVLP